MLKALLGVLIGIWTATIAGAAVLAVRFYLKERRAGGLVRMGRPVGPTQALQAAGAGPTGAESRSAVPDQRVATEERAPAAFPSRPFIVLPGSRVKRRGRRRRRSAPEQLLVR